MFLPLPNGSIESSKSNLLFDETFLSQVKEYKFDNPLLFDTLGIKINIDKDYFLGLYSKLFGNINIREQMKIIDLVQVCHNISKDAALLGGYYLENFEYQHLIWEILVCVNLLITKKFPTRSWFNNRQIQDSETSLSFDFSIGRDNEVYSNYEFSRKFSENLISVFSIHGAKANLDNIITITIIPKDELQIQNNESFILAYYQCFDWVLLNYYNTSLELSKYRMLFSKISKEQKFLQEFQKNMMRLIN